MKKLLIICLLLLASTSCSVIMAAKKDGVDISRVQGCRTRGQILAYRPLIVSSTVSPSGELVEVYQVQKPRGSASRAFMHGVLDLSTCGLWELIGTPIEACNDQREYVVVRIFYDYYENVQRIELI